LRCFADKYASCSFKQAFFAEEKYTGFQKCYIFEKDYII